LRVTLALLGVVGLIVAMKIAVRWLWPGAGAQRASRSVRVLARTPINSRSSLVLVQVGKRLVVVGDSATQLSPICEITDPDEVAAMLGAIQTERLGAASRRFALKLGKAEAEFESPDDDDDDETIASEVPPENPVSGSNERMDRLRSGSLSDVETSEDRSEENCAIVDVSVDARAEPEALVNTRQELRGLASRVRAIAEQFRKPSA
jgi:flagellar biogenesis protein FliO